ncbi:hypothetical protein HOLleu_04077 [Holothuria leucospilota]|uniref:Uncharacterized protein n=1 Tax=Holothuria leucospilota TaxID=206669 RepID=A0A9Q1HKL3_HOLLE|nr:hypothetical protein HOLleu_04077 [Holothuria leucospilota]
MAMGLEVVNSEMDVAVEEARRHVEEEEGREKHSKGKTYLGGSLRIEDRRRKNSQKSVLSLGTGSGRAQDMSSSLTGRRPSVSFHSSLLRTSSFAGFRSDETPVVMYCQDVMFGVNVITGLVIRKAHDKICKRFKGASVKEIWLGVMAEDSSLDPLTEDFTTEQWFNEESPVLMKIKSSKGWQIFFDTICPFGIQTEKTDGDELAMPYTA